MPTKYNRNKIFKAATFIAAMGGHQACMPSWADFPNAEERETMQYSINTCNELLPLMINLALNSDVAMVDGYGNIDESGNKQVTADLKEKNTLLNWFYSQDRILVYDREDYEKENAGGVYRANFASGVDNDWISIPRDSLSHTEVYTHEVAHALYPYHSDEVLTFVESSTYQDYDSGEMLAYSIQKQPDPAYQDGSFISATQTFASFTDAQILSLTDAWEIKNAVSNEHITPQEGYNELLAIYRGSDNLKKNTRKAVREIRDSNLYMLWPLQLEEDDLVKSIMEWPGYREHYEQLWHQALDAYENEFLKEVSVKSEASKARKKIR